MAENLCHSSFRILTIIAIIRQFHHNTMAVHRPHGLPARDKNITANLLVIRDHKTIILILLKNTGYFRKTALNNLKHLSFSPLGCPCTARRDSRCHQLDQNRIPVKSTLCLIRRDKYVMLHTLNCHKTKAPCTAAELACEGIRFCLLISPILSQCQFSASNELIQKFLEFLLLTLRH